MSLPRAFAQPVWPRPWRGQAGLLRGCLLALLLAHGGVQAQAQGQGDRVVTEDAVKAAYLYKLRNYVEWPAGRASSRIVIGVVGADELQERLQDMPQVKDRINGSVTVRPMRVGDPLDGVAILYIDDAHWRKAGEMAALAASLSVLVVTDSANALNGGSVINFRWVDARIRFEISLDAADQAGLKLSSQLLALATNVQRDKRK